MKTPEQWLKELVTVRFMLCADVAAIQADARADLLEQNRRMREILDASLHNQYRSTLDDKLHCVGSCPACRWESLKKEMGV